MFKQQSYIRNALTGALYGVLLIALSRLFIRNLSKIFYIIGSIMQVDDEQVTHVAHALEQLKTAKLVSPWMVVILLGCIVGICFSKIMNKCKRKKSLSICLSVILSIVFVFGMVVFTEVNDMQISRFYGRSRKTPEYQMKTYESNGDTWNLGFGRRKILPDENSAEPLYIAGYKNRVEIGNVLDYCEARATWIDTGEKGILLIGIDCVALDSSTVQKIREALLDLPDCEYIHVYATHTHAGIDTLGMWGPVGIDGKNEDYMEKLIQAAKEAGREACEQRTAGKMYFGQMKTENMLYDSRIPQVYDENLYQLRFEPENAESGIRLYFYGAHAESLRGNNIRLSRDFPGMFCDQVTEMTGDNTMFCPGAIGGLIMTDEFTDTSWYSLENMEMTADKLTEYALAITKESEQELKPAILHNNKKCAVPMDNIAFWLYKFLGILGNKAIPADSATGFGVETEMSVFMMDDLAITFIPGEIFPELVTGTEYGDVSPENENPAPLYQIAKEHGIEKMLIVGLANDEIGYIVPPSDFLLNKEMPYLERTMDYKCEDHYEETNSIGPECANVIAETFEKLVKELD